MKILVTGGTGVVGTGAIPALVRENHQVRLLSRHAERDAPAFPRGVEAFDADIADGAALQTAVQGCDAVLHIAGIAEEAPPEITFEKANVEGTRNLLDAAASAGAPYFIYISSLGADAPQSAYHESKLRAEKLVQQYPGDWLILRPGAVYGPGDETISMLLKMLRSLPAVPIVDDGAQPFQPLWYSDFGDVIAQAVGRRELAGRTLDVAGPEVTTTNDILERLAGITGRNPPRVAVPAWLAQVGTQAVEAFGAMGKKLLRRGGLEVPITDTKLKLLLAQSVIPDPERNAPLTEFEIAPTPLQEGLEMLAELVPEQLPGDGVGALQHTTYFAVIRGSRFSAADLIGAVCDRMCDVMPLEFAAEPRAPEQAVDGATMTAEIAGRGHVQVRVFERTPTRVSFVTLEGHPLAGVMQLEAEDVPGGLRFSVYTIAQPADVLDWIAMKTLGGAMQRQNWRNVVRRVIALTEGEAPEGVQRNTRTLTDDEKHELQAWIEPLVQEHERVRQAREMARP